MNGLLMRLNTPTKFVFDAKQSDNCLIYCAKQCSINKRSFSLQCNITHFTEEAT